MERKLALLAGTFCVLMMSCQNPVAMRTRVNENGSLTKTIALKKAEKKLAVNNMFGIREGNGWRMQLEKLPDSLKENKDKDEYLIRFEKEFGSVDEVNKELDIPSDTLFQIEHTFDKRFRWFYTYIRYTERVRPLNRFKIEKPVDYFNREDSLFIDRLPGNGKSISKADSVFLNSLSDKVNSTFANMAIFREEYAILEAAVKQAGLDKKWLDTLMKQQEYIYNHTDKMKGDPFFAEKIADSLNIPFQKPQSSKMFSALARDLNARVDFMSFANNGDYENEIEMPWAIVSTNADSVAGNTAYWRPLSLKFAFRDYTMFAESRKLNTIPAVVSVLVVALTIFLFLRRKS